MSEMSFPRSVEHSGSAYKIRNSYDNEIKLDQAYLDRMEKQFRDKAQSRSNMTYISEKSNPVEPEQKDFFILIRIKGKNLADLEGSEHKLQAIANKSAKILNVEKQGKVTLNVLDASQKNNFFFPGHQKSVEIKVNEWAGLQTRFEFRGVGLIRSPFGSAPPRSSIGPFRSTSSLD